MQENRAMPGFTMVLVYNKYGTGMDSIGTVYVLPDKQLLRYFTEIMLVINDVLIK